MMSLACCTLNLPPLILPLSKSFFEQQMSSFGDPIQQKLACWAVSAGGICGLVKEASEELLVLGTGWLVWWSEFQNVYSFCSFSFFMAYVFLVFSFLPCEVGFKNAWNPRAFIGIQPDSLCSQTCMVSDKSFGFLRQTWRCLGLVRPY